MGWQDLDAAITYNYCRLALRVLRMAISEAKYGDRNCREWLRYEGVFWADSLGLEPEVLIKWIKDLPKPTRKSRNKIKIIDGQLELDYSLSVKEMMYVPEREGYPPVVAKSREQPAYAGIRVT